MKKPNCFSLCLLFLVGIFIVSCTGDPLPSMPAEEHHYHHHATETEWDEEFWQKLQTDIVFTRLREVSSYAYLFREIDEGMDEDSFRKAFRNALDNRTTEVVRLNDSLLALYPEKYDIKYFTKALNDNDAQTRSPQWWFDEVIVNGQRSHFRVVDHFFMILDDINSYGNFVCPSIQYMWPSYYLGPGTSSAQIWCIYDFLLEYASIDKFYNTIYHRSFGSFYVNAARGDVQRASGYINGTTHYYPDRISLNEIVALTQHLSGIQSILHSSGGVMYHEFAGCNCLPGRNPGGSTGSGYDGDTGENGTPDPDPDPDPDPPLFNVTLEASPSYAGLAEGGGRNLEYYTQVPIEAYPNTGWKFVEWTIEGSRFKSSPLTTFTVTGDAHIVAHFEPDDPENIPLTGVEINVSQYGSAYLGAKYTLSITKIPEDATEEIAYVEYYSNGWSLGFVRGGDDYSYEFTARLPGEHRFMARVIIAGKESYPPLESAESDVVVHRFPTAPMVEAEFSDKMNSLWETSKAAGTLSSTYEYAAVMWIDTSPYVNSLWDFQSVQSDSYLYSQNIFRAPFDKIDTDVYNSDDPNEGGRWIVGWFHTHPSWHNASEPRVVGKSVYDVDPEDGIPAWVMDYKSDGWDRDGNPTISPNGARLIRYAEGELKKYGGNGRTN